MRTMLARTALVLAFFLASSASAAVAQSPDLWADMHWRGIGPTRAGRTRALAGVADQPNVFYIGFDNGGVWRTTDYGSTWQPMWAIGSSSPWVPPSSCLRTGAEDPSPMTISSPSAPA